MMVMINGWLVVYLPLWKYDFVSWDDDYSQYMESHKIPWFQATNQYIYIYGIENESLFFPRW